MASSDYVFRVLDEDGDEVLSIGVTPTASRDPLAMTLTRAHDDVRAVFRSSRPSTWSVSVLNPEGETLASLPFWTIDTLLRTELYETGRKVH